MNCNIPTLNIDLTDCVGDSLGKHNYNTLMLDTLICNLSSNFYNIQGNIYTIFKDLSSIMDQVQNLIPLYTVDEKNNFSIANTTVNLLSSYWSNHELTVEYPTNGSTYDTPNAISYSGFNSIDSFVNSRLRILGNSYLVKDFPVQNYTANTIINVVFLIYNISPNPHNPNSLVENYSNPTNFKYLDRYMTLNFKKQDINIQHIFTLKYQKINNRWTYINYTYGN